MCNCSVDVEERRAARVACHQIEQELEEQATEGASWNDLRVPLDSAVYAIRRAYLAGMEAGAILTITTTETPT